jgi:hypothetical protein
MLGYRRIAYFISNPGLRRLAELALEFATVPFRGDIPPLEFAVFYSPEGFEDAVEFLREHVSGVVADELAMSYRDPALYFLEPPGVVVKVLDDLPSFMVLHGTVHEVVHHVHLRAMPELREQFWDEIFPEIVKVGEAVWNYPEEEAFVLDGSVEGALMDLDVEMYWFFMQLVSEYTAINYFVLLNEEPRLDFARLWEVGTEALRKGEESVYAILWCVTEVLTNIRTRLNYIRRGIRRKPYREDFKRNVLSLLDTVHRKLLSPEYAGFREEKIYRLLHSELLKILERTPAAVYRGNPERYRPLFEDLPREELRRYGIPFGVAGQAQQQSPGETGGSPEESGGSGEIQAFLEEMWRKLPRVVACRSS